MKMILRRIDWILMNLPSKTGPRRHLSAMFGFGCFLVAVAAIHVIIPVSAEHTIIHTLLELGLLGLPAVGVLGLAYRASLTSIDDELYPLLTYWTIGTAGALVVVGWLLLYYFAVPFWIHDSLFASHFWVVLGAFGGSFIGFHHVRALTQARKATLSQEQRDRLKYLNHLLRHDLRNNLMVIEANADLALDEVDEEAAKHLKTIRQQSEQAADLIENVRAFLQSSQGDQPLEPIDLTATIEAELTQLRDAYPEATLTAELPELVSVQADPLLESVFENLIRNAIEHNDATQPEVTITVDVGKDTVTATVTDNGPGIPSNVRESLFDPSDEGEHGFGLYLVQTLVSNYSGDVRIVETGPAGTSVQVELNKA